MGGVVKNAFGEWALGWNYKIPTRRGAELRQEGMIKFEHEPDDCRVQQVLLYQYYYALLTYVRNRLDYPIDASPRLPPEGEEDLTSIGADPPELWG